MVRQLEARGHVVTLIDSEERRLPLLDRMYKEYEQGTAPPDMEAIAQTFRDADGFVIVSAEYNHSIPAALKNLLDHFQQEYLYKPSAIVTYSAGPFGGVRGLANLRTILAELGTPGIPSAFPISQVHKAFDDDGNAVEAAYEQRVAKFLDEYEWYARALMAARDREIGERDMPVQQTLCRGGK
jgi:NAD(P)H-dependent FMN reductase